MRRAIKRLKAGKAPGVDGIVAEILKAGGEEIVKALTQLCRKAWREEKLPTDWTRELFVFLKMERRKTHKTIEESLS